jgi:hypothetical protein
MFFFIRSESQVWGTLRMQSIVPLMRVLSYLTMNTQYSMRLCLAVTDFCINKDTNTFGNEGGFSGNIQLHPNCTTRE